MGSPIPKMDDSTMQEMKLENDTHMGGTLNNVPEVGERRQEPASEDNDQDTIKVARPSDSPRKSTSGIQSPAIGKVEQEETVGGDITLKIEPGKAPKLARTTSQKVIPRQPQLFSHLPDATADATRSFDILTDCSYAAKYLGYSEPALECDCSEEWDSGTHTNQACGEDSDCINRATKMECVGDCGCGAECQNQRFQLKQYSNVSVIKTEKKGFGLRADTDLKADDFIFEYIGEVIAEPAFRRRMHNYDQEGIKHFYFMSLTKGEFVDATKKGNLGRFCNHSCNPNCYVDKWVVGDKLRMGIFAERKIQAGEELVFNYNVDRYGADPQPCYCGEPNCVGFIGGKTQTDRATKLSHSTIEALGLEDADDWDVAVAKKPRKKKTGEDDEEYVSNVTPKSLDEDGVAKVMATLGTCKENWIAVKLLSRIQRADDDRVRLRVIKMHGYRLLNMALKTFKDDINVVLQIFDILARFPRLTRNKIQDSGIETTVGTLTESDNDLVKQQASTLIEEWSKLEVAFRIRKMKRDPVAIPARPDRRESTRDRSRSRSRSPPKSADTPRGPTAPTGPRSNLPQRAGFGGGSRPYRPRPPPGVLPPGWFEAVAQNGSTYYYNASGATTWQRPTQPAMAAPPPPPPKAVANNQILQDLINSIVSKTDNTKAKDPRQTVSSSNTTPAETPNKVRKEDKWKSYSEEKQKKLYENTLFPHISYVMNKYKKHLERGELKRWGKEVAKKMVNSDYKHGRVKDPTAKLDSKAEKQVKAYAREFFDKVMKKKKAEREQSKAKALAAKAAGSTTPIGSPPNADKDMTLDAGNDDVELSDNEVEDEDSKVTETPSDPQLSPASRKRKAEEDEQGLVDGSSKRMRSESEADDTIPPPPPPPPPPPAETNVDEVLEAGLTPDDEARSMNNGLLEAVTNGGTTHMEDATDLDNGTGPQASVKIGNGSLATASPMHLDERNSPMQTATPPTTGSPDLGEDERARKKREFGGLNPERMRALGLDGTTD